MSSEDEFCDKCKSTVERARDTFASFEDNKKLGDRIEKQFPYCLCEEFRIGQGSSGPVADSEQLYRLLISPRDYDPETGRVFEQQFHKVFQNGLSVCRSIASDGDISTLVEEGLQRATSKEPEPRRVWLVCAADTLAVRETRIRTRKHFCVYDQTVQRTDKTKDPVPTHASIFLREPVPGTHRRNIFQKDFAGLLKKLFLQKQIVPSDFRDGLIDRLNERSQAGEFVFEVASSPQESIPAPNATSPDASAKRGE